MKLFLLLILPLMTGCEVSSEESKESKESKVSKVKGCAQGWVEFTCNYPTKKKDYQTIDVVTPERTIIRSMERNVWENTGRVSLYHDTEKRNLRVAIKQFECQDFGDYKCKFYRKKDSTLDTEEESWELNVETDSCQGLFIQTAYRTAETTITCDYPRKKYKKKSKFFCRDNSLTCEDILSTKSSPKSKGTFTLTNTNSGFKVSISNVASQHAGVYWCGVESKTGRYRAALRQIQLKVHNITTFKRSPTIGENFEYWCGYPHDAPMKKFICKGEDPSMCEPLVNTAQPNNNTGRFSMKDDTEKTNLTITVREVTTDDTGTYWCGAESTNRSHSNPFFHRLQMTVVPETPSTPSVISSTSHHSVSSTQRTSLDSHGGSSLTVTIVTVVCIAVLVLLGIVVLAYKRFERSKNTKNVDAQDNKEDRAYEEIQEHPQKPGSGTALKTIYTTANFPTNPSVTQHYSNGNIQNSSSEVGGDTYSTVRDTDQSPTYSTVNHPTTMSEDPFYSTINMPQQP